MPFPNNIIGTYGYQENDTKDLYFATILSSRGLYVVMQ